jgi:hypothetical protein
MKALSFRRVSLVIGLAVGIMVLWVAAAPSAIGADSFIGGWVPYSGCCNGSDVEACSDGEDGGGNHPCDGGDTNVCLVSTPYQCQGTGCPQLCWWRGFGTDICTTTHDSECENDPMPCP